MRHTSYNFFANLYRYSGFYVAFLIFVGVILALFIEREPIEINLSGLLFFIFIVLLFGIVNAWIHPVVKIAHDGIIISRFRFITRKVTWDKIKLSKKVRTFTKFGLIGLDPRYAFIKIKDATIFDNFIIILSFFNGYDEFIRTIELNINN